jgi:DNA-binding MarR family transcriptional regulator
MDYQMEGSDVFLKFFIYIRKLENAFLSRGEFRDLSVSEIHTIAKAGGKYRKTISDLAEAMGVTVSTMTTGINRLIKKGYLSKTRCDTDRRIIFVALTAVGEKAYLAYEKFYEEMVKRAFDKLNPKDRSVFRRCLSGIAEYFSTDNTWELYEILTH